MVNPITTSTMHTPGGMKNHHAPSDSAPEELAAFSICPAITARSDRLLLGRAELLLEDPSSFELAMACELWSDHQPIRRGAAGIGGAVRAAKAEGAQR